ncbi:MAG: DNA polymerase IV [Firmicutes bacterium]|nr:DNA polymerase IV [Bacillota bacterium]
MERTIVHVDMDAFYAAVEQRDNPELRGKPVIVGAPKDAKRGVVATCSYEARKYGVRSAMPISEAVRLCPDGVYLVPDMRRYVAVSRQIHKIFEEFTPVVEPVSIDEAFLDMTGCMHRYSDETDLGMRIKKRIAEETSLTASVGVSVNKLLAKLASDAKKPDGLVVVKSHQIDNFLFPMPLRRLYGVGKKTADALERKGLRLVSDVRRRGLEAVERDLGEFGRHLYRLCCGQDDRPVGVQSGAKSISREITFQTDISGLQTVLVNVAKLIPYVGQQLRRTGMRARTVTVKIRYSKGFATITRSTTLPESFDDDDTIYDAARQLVQGVDRLNAIRLVGVGVSGLREEKQASLLYNKEDRELTRVLDDINLKYGKQVVFRGRSLERLD